MSRAVKVGLLAGVLALVLAAGSAAGAGRSTTLGTRAAPAQTQVEILGNSGAKWSDYNPPAEYPKTATLPTQYLTMSDGVQLAALVTLPADAAGKALPGPFPVVVMQTAYNQEVGRYEPALGGADSYIVEHGYAEVVVDVRGTGSSGGQWQAFGAAEQSDYGTVVDWAVAQPWSDHKVGVYGISYVAISALFTAEQRNPAVKAAFLIVPAGDTYRDIVFTGGQASLLFTPAWLMFVTGLSLLDPAALSDPSQGVPVVLQHVENALADFQVPLLLEAVLGDPGVADDGAFWALRSPVERAAEVDVPTFLVGGLHDAFQRGDPLVYEQMKTRTTAKFLQGPWTHIQAALGTGLPADGVPVLDHIELRWFDEYLKGIRSGADSLPNVTQYVTGYGHYATATDWPHPQAQAQRLYLHGDRALSAAAPGLFEPANKVLQVPIEGLCSISMSQWTLGILGLVPLPCFSNDNLTELWDVKYDTAPMTADYYINGPIEADLWVSTTALDTGLSVRVDDVDAQGKATALTDGLLTASMRAVDPTRSRLLDGQAIQPWHPFTAASKQMVVPGQTEELSVEIFPTSAMIAQGHRLRIAVGASDLPQGIPPLPVLADSALGLLTVTSNQLYPSSVVLPVVPAGVLP